MKKNHLFFLLLALLLSENSFSRNNHERERQINEGKWYYPDYMKVQYAGNIGFMAIGLGYNWWKEVVQSDFLYGYVHENHGNATIHTFTFKNTFRLYKFRLLNKYNISPILGFSLSMEPGENSYMSVPERYPDGYYRSNSFYACFNAGVKTNFKFKDERQFSAIDLYVEINTLADYVYYNIVAQEDRSSKIYSMALGVNIFF